MTNPPNSPNLEPMTRTQILIVMAVTAIGLLLVARIWMQVSTVNLLAVQLTGVAVGQGILLGLGISLASILIYQVWADYRHSADYYLELIIKPLILLDLIWLGLLPGLSEELLFRGIMLPEFGLNWQGLTLSSICFGVLHLSSLKHWAYVVWASVIGIVLGISVIQTGNLLVPIVAHVFTNILSGLIWKFRHRSS